MKAYSIFLVAIGVIAGAFGAHALKDILTPERLEVFKTAVFYQISMSIVLFLLAQEQNLSQTVVWMLLVGIIIFSGSLYLLVLLNKPILGAVTPIGGTLIILSLLISAWQLRK